MKGGRPTAVKWAIGVLIYYLIGTAIAITAGAKTSYGYTFDYLNLIDVAAHGLLLFGMIKMSRIAGCCFVLYVLLDIGFKLSLGATKLGLTFAILGISIWACHSIFKYQKELKELRLKLLVSE